MSVQNKSWPENEGYTDMLVATALMLEARFPGRTVAAVGHSPSWLVYTLGLLRRAAGKPAQTAYIPHSGHILQADRSDAYSLREPDQPVRFSEGTLYEAGPRAVTGYFNFLARRRIDPAALKAQSREGRPVLVDFVRTGDGYASFLDVYDRMNRTQCGCGLAQDFSVVAFKMHYREGVQSLQLPALQGAAEPRTIPADIISGTPGILLNTLAGTRGTAAQKDDMTRFMPYYSLADGYKPEWNNGKYVLPCPGLRLAARAPEQVDTTRTALRGALVRAVRDPAGHEAACAAATAALTRAVPEPVRRGWISMYGYGH